MHILPSQFSEISSDLPVKMVDHSYYRIYAHSSTTFAVQIQMGQEYPGPQYIMQARLLR